MDRAHLSGSTVKKQQNQDITEAAGEERREIRNIEIAIRNIGLNSKETAKSSHNGGGGGGEGEIRNIEIAIRNIGPNNKETAKSRHNGGGEGGEE